MSVLDRKLHRRGLLRWMGVTGAVALFPALQPCQSLRTIRETDLSALTAVCPVLYDDDERELVKLVKLIFDRQGWTLIGTSNSFEALEICRTQPISLVISDIMKPEMNGYQMLNILRADPATREIPLMFFSACGQQASIHEARMLGACDYVVKPAVPVELLMAVRHQLLGRGRWQPEALARLV